MSTTARTTEQKQYVLAYYLDEGNRRYYRSTTSIHDAVIVRLSKSLKVLLPDQDPTNVYRVEAYPAVVEALKQCSKLFHSIRGDWSDPRAECREGWAVIDAALSDVHPAKEDKG